MKKQLAKIVTAILIAFVTCNSGLKAIENQNALLQNVETKVFKINMGGQVQEISLYKLGDKWYVPFELLNSNSDYDFKLDEKNGTIVVTTKAKTSASEETPKKDDSKQYEKTDSTVKDNFIKTLFDAYVKKFMQEITLDKNKYYSYYGDKQNSKKAGWSRLKFKVKSNYSYKLDKTSGENSQYVGTLIYHISISQSGVCATKALADKNNQYNNPEDVTIKNIYVYKDGKWIFQSGQHYTIKDNTWQSGKYEYYMEGFAIN